MSASLERIVPELPPECQRLRLLIDSDVATEIDDLYAIALALRAPQRFAIEGFVATHFAQKAGRASIEQSYRLLLELLQVAGLEGRYPVVRGGDPIPYLDEPCASDGARLIIERAHAGSEDNPLWVLGLGAASNLASAVLLDPTICRKVRYVFHARSEWSWPKHNEQYNVTGDVRAARALLLSQVPLVWFDTGQQIVCDMATTERELKPQGRLGEYLHEFRQRRDWFKAADKGFFDLADVAWMLAPACCESEVVDVPEMDWLMRFVHNRQHGKMLRVFGAKAEPVWSLFFHHLRA